MEQGAAKGANATSSEDVSVWSWGYKGKLNPRPSVQGPRCLIEN